MAKIKIVPDFATRMRPDGAGKNSGCTIELSEEL